MNQDVVPIARQAPICRLEDIPDGGARGLSVHVGETWDLILLRRGDAVSAFHNECPHAGRNLDYAPGQFLVRNGRITCAVHGAVFDTASGECCGGPARSGLVAVPVKVVDGAVWLDDVPASAG